VVAFNQVAYFYDGINTARIFDRELHWPFQPNGPQRGVDIVGNVIYGAHDDGIQVDHVGINHRVQSNRVFWAFAGISFQSLIPGPVFASRNVVTDVGWAAWKIRTQTTGVRLYNNSSVSAFEAVSTGPEVLDVQAFNNLFIGNYEARLGPWDSRSRWDHNAYSLGSRGSITWAGSQDASGSQNFKTLAGWVGSTGYETNGLELQLGQALRGAVSTEPASVPLSASVLVPRVDGPLSGTGLGVPRVSSAPQPEIGALAPGGVVPHYGPRRLIPGAVARGLYEDEANLRLTLASVGYSPLTVREQIVRFIDVYNVSLPLMTGVAFTVGLLVGIVAATWWAQRRYRRGSATR
jgi:hypothetical protein